MRILFCNFEYPPLGGGGGVINSLLAQEMAKRHEVTVLTSQGLGLPRDVVENGVRIVRVPVYFRKQKAVASVLSMLAFILVGIKAGKKLLKTNQYDVINTHFVLPTGQVGDVLAHVGRIPNVLTLHGGDLYDPSKFTSPHRHPLLRAWIRRLLKRADWVVGGSRNTLENMHHFYTKNIEGDRIPLGIQRPPKNIASRRDYGFSENDVLLVTVGRLVARKAVEQLIALIKTLQMKEVHLLIIGSGPQEVHLKKEVMKLQLEKQVHFLCRVEESEKFQILQMCDLYVSTSQHEGFGLVFLEAMACGLPVICYKNGGQIDFLENTTSGYLLPLNDFSAFKDKCQLLIKDNDLRRRIGQVNLKHVEEFFIDRCAQRYEAIFNEAVASYRK
jgi:glycosyltransferase involved in cell wall biosynthesis